MSDPITQAAIQARAYQLWEESGCMEGHHEEHWRDAEAECRAGPVDDRAMTDRADGPTTLPGLDGDGGGAMIRSDSAGAVSPDGRSDPTPASGIDGEISRPLIDVKSKPRRWPTPIVDV